MALGGEEVNVEISEMESTLRDFFLNLSLKLDDSWNESFKSNIRKLDRDWKFLKMFCYIVACQQKRRDGWERISSTVLPKIRATADGIYNSLKFFEDPAGMVRE